MLRDTRYIDIREGDKLDEAYMATWVHTGVDIGLSFRDRAG
jgi:hypothetical protein